MNTITAQSTRSGQKADSRRWLLALLLLLTGPAAFAQLSGTYTINSALATGGTNYASFTDAATALATGVSGPVTFNVSGGPYTEQISIPAITGASATNRIIFNGNGRTIRYGATVTGQRAVIALSGADYITLDSLNIDATNGGNPGTYGWGMHITGQADYNTVRRCVVTTSETSTSSNFAGIVVSGSATIGTTAGNNANNLLLEGNTISGGYYGITLVGTSSTVRAANNIVRNNTIRNFYYYGVYAYYQDGVQYVGNDIHRTTRATVSSFYGLYMYYNYGMSVVGNRIHDPFTAAGASTLTVYGIYVYYSDGTATAPVLVANNLVYNLNGGGTIYGIYNYYSDYVDIYHNTVTLDDATTGTTLRAYSQYAGTYATVRNNIFSMTQPSSTAAYAMYIYYPAATPPITTSNNNDLYAGSAANSYIGYYGTTTTATSGGAATLAAWQTANPTFDLNSESATPYFVSAATGNLRPTAAVLDGAGTTATLTRVPRDFAGVLRTSPPDIGAYEFTPAANDVALRRVASPTSPLTIGSRPVAVSIRNNGGSTLTRVTLAYTLNGGTPVTQAFTGLTVAAGDTTLLTFTTPGTFVSGVNALHVVGSLPNGTVDANPGNNTLDINLYSALAGAYTINSAQPSGGTNFTSFTDAATALNQGGVLSAVTFNVSGGPYTEQISLSPISGASATSRVIFNGNGRTIQFAASNNNQRAVIALNGADYVTLDSLNIDATNGGNPGTYGWGLLLTGQADNNIVRRCVVTSSETSTSSSFAGIVVSGSATAATTPGNNANNLLLEGNTVAGGYYGITLVGTSSTLRAMGNILRNNTVRDFYYYGVYGYYQDGVQYLGNDINRATRTVNTTFYGLYMYYNYNMSVVGNRVHDPFTVGFSATAAFYGIYVYYSDGTATAPILVANNLVYNVNGGGTTYGIYNYYSDYVDYFHNTVNLDHTSTGTAVRAYTQYTGVGTTLRNNIFSVTRPSSTAAYAMYFYSTTTAPSTVTSNYNDLYAGTAANSYIGYFGATSTATTGGAATLAAWQTLNSSDANSVSLDPRFRSSTDVRPTAVNLNGTGTPTTLTRVPRDIANVLRTSPPDMGAYEFSPVANEVELLSIDSPVSPASPGNNPVTVTIRNGGTAVLTSVAVSYTLNGGTPVAQTFTGLTVAAGATLQLTFTAGVVPPSGSNTLTATASLPNGQADSDPSNNTQTITFDQPTPANDEPCTAVALGTGTLTGSNSGASTSAQNGINTPTCAGGALPKDVWFSFTPTATSTTLTLTGDPAGAVRVFSTPDCAAGPFNQIFCQGSGANNTTIGAVTVTGLTAGQRYYVAVSGFSGSDTAGSFTISGSGLLTGTRAQANTNALLVYPNPSSTGQLTLSLNGVRGTGTVELLNALGQSVLRQPLAAAAEQSLSTRGLAAGFYTLRVQASGEVLTRKVVLQ